MPLENIQAARDFSIQVVRQLRDAGHVAYWAGGCVRDQLLGAEPKDYDVATDATPTRIREIFGRQRTLAIGAAFGVITVLGPKSAGQIEVATFREDAAYSDGRHPDAVRFSDAKADAQRRDFTINGMFYDPLEQQTIDYVGGREDIERRVIRAIGDASERVREDKLRMLRAVRFAAVLDFELDRETLEVVRASADQIDVVSPERISQELRRMLAHANRSRAVELLLESRLLAQVFPELSEIAEQNREEWRVSLAALAALPNEADSSVALSLLLRPLHLQLGLDDVDAVGTRLRFARDEIETMKHVLAHEALIRAAVDTAWPTVQRVLVERRVEALLQASAALGSVLGGADGVNSAPRSFACPTRSGTRLR